jgi:hypothetical protein
MVNEGGEFALEILDGGEVAAAEHFAREDGKPHLDLVEPRGVLGREVEDDAMAGVAQEARARGHRLEDAVLAFDAEVAVDAAATKRTTASEQWMLRLSMIRCQRVSSSRCANNSAKHGAKSCSVRVGPMR